ncbi:MAG TPA: BTAD domain-containing putative transcriptional regulator, partial [Thermomicrobiales bacterium]
MVRSTIPGDVPGAGDGTPTLRLRLLGGFQAAVGDEPIPDDAWARRKAQAVVKLLALSAGHALHREEVLEALWPEADPAAARNSLNQALHAARRALGPAAAQLRVAGERLILVPPVWVDVAAFEGAALAARRSSDPALYEAALDLYTGDLLPENRYEDWAAGRREALRGTRLALLSEFAILQEGRGAPDLAIAALERAVEQEPANEEAHVALMRLHARVGRRDVAVRHWARLRDALRRELDVAPSPASEAAYRQLLADTTAPLRVPDASAIPLNVRRAHNLPASLTSFVGRLRERAEVRELLERGARDTERGAQVLRPPGPPPRFVTLLGPGGAGKTRLALAVAHDLVGVFSDGVWLVELAGLADPALVPAALAAALGVGEAAGRALTDTLVEALRQQELLLVLDNCEHLIDACAALGATLLTSCPALHILATSRAALRVPGELTWVVPPLAVPEPRDAGAPPLTEGDLTVLAGVDALTLLVERARLRQPTFALTTANAHALMMICQRLDGLPLALELAAARLAHLAPAQISARLDDALALLTGGSRSAPTRQQTLRAALDWSYATLDKAERVALRRLAPFAGGFDLAAAEAVCDERAAGVASPARSAEVLDLLGSLVDKSLLSVEADGGHARYRTLEVVRQYAAEQLRASGEEASTRARHAAHYLALAEEAERHLQGPQQRTWLDHLEREADNLRAASDWLIAGGEAYGALRLSGALWWYWYVRGHLTEGREQLARALALPSGDADGDRLAPPRAKALLGAGVLAWRQGHLDRAN